MVEVVKEKEINELKSNLSEIASQIVARSQEGNSIIKNATNISDCVNIVAKLLPQSKSNSLQHEHINSILNELHDAANLVEHNFDGHIKKLKSLYDAHQNITS